MTTSSSSSSSAVNLQRIWYPCRSTYHHAQQFSFNAVTLRPPFPNLPSRRQYPRLASLSNYNTTSFQPQPTFTSSVGSPPPISHQWTLTQRHLILLNFIAAATAISATWLFFSAIPTLLAFKKAAESLEKLFDVTREELPDTMATVRLSGMEISDLTTELSDLGQEITQGVKSSTRAVRLAEERLRRLTNMNPSASMQVAVQMKSTPAGPVVARTARGIRESIVKGRSFLQMFFSITQFLKVAIKYLKSRGKSKA